MLRALAWGGRWIEIHREEWRRGGGGRGAGKQFSLLIVLYFWIQDWRDEGRREPGANPEPGLGFALLVLAIAWKVMWGVATNGRATLHKRTLTAGGHSYTLTDIVRSNAALLLPVSWKEQQCETQLEEKLSRSTCRSDDTKRKLPELGVFVVATTIGETVGVVRQAGDDLWGNSGLEILPRLQSRKQPFWMGLEENWPCR